MNVFSERLRRSFTLLENAEMTHLIVSSQSNLFYLTGKHIDTGERLCCLLLSRDAPPMLLIHQMFLGQLMLPSEIEIVSWADEDDPLERLSPFLQRATVIGIDQTWRSSYLIGLMKILPHLKTATSEIIEKLREIKDEGEINLIRQSSRIADAVMHQVIQLQHLPATERQVAETIRSFFGEHQVYQLSFQPIIGFGKNSANPHHEIGDSGLRPEQSVVIDMGGIYQHYCSDITRTMYYGKPNQRFEEIYNIVRYAQELAISMVMPGVPLADIDLTIRREFAKWGYDRFYTHRTGHGLGLELHEGPFLHQKSQTVAAPGMVFSIEPGIYLPDQFGIRIEDIVAVTETGCEVLTLSPKEVSYLEQLGV